jgi:hypothetical protein
MPLYDEFDDPQQEGTFSRMLNMFNRGPIAARKPFFALAVVGGLAVLFGVVLYVSYPRGGAQQADENVPIIRADATPVKAAPDSQGGMEIPNRESTVFNTMRGQGPDSKVESLLPQTEQPIDRSKVFAGVRTDTIDAKPVDLTESASQMASAAPASGQQAAETQDSGQDEKGAPAPAESVQVGGAAGFAPQPVPSGSAATPASVAEESTTVTPQGSVATRLPNTAMHTDTQPAAAASAPVPESAKAEAATGESGVTVSEPVKAAALAAPKGLTATAKGNSYVQLASITNRGAASASWQNLQKKYPQLAGEKYRVQAATVKGQTFYRVQAGPLSADKAKAVCKSVNAKKAGACLVVSG